MGNKVLSHWRIGYYLIPEQGFTRMGNWIVSGWGSCREYYANDAERGGYTTRNMGNDNIVGNKSGDDGQGL